MRPYAWGFANGLLSTVGTATWVLWMEGVCHRSTAKGVTLTVQYFIDVHGHVWVAFVSLVLQCHR